MTLRLIPAGDFMMGSPGDDKDAALDETPRHKVRISAFYLGVTEVTQAQYKELMGNNPSHFSATGDGKYKVAGRPTGQYPVERVSWLDAVHFCDTLSEQEARIPFYQERNQDQGRTDKDPGYRLPTEAEWEYACRARTATRYFFGDSGPTLREYGWFHGNAEAMTHPVGEKQPNDFGLYDMHGNVREWCSDWFDDAYYQHGPAIDPQGPAVGVRHVIRGGTCVDRPPLLRSAGRSHGAADGRGGYLGFRVALGQLGH
jgi:formylglycine-generating enzyme required for sulfatase activity